MIFILTGAGISQESGIDTFRDKGGIWDRVRVEDVATATALCRDRRQVLAFFNQRRTSLKQPQVVPNPAHKALARLERESRLPVLVVTQNVDDLHERAGSRNLLHMHGEAFKARCEACGSIHPWDEDISLETICPDCREPGRMRPHIVLFEEMPLFLDEIAEALARCTLFVSIGTSGNVYPAAGFAAEARARGARVMELNLEPSAGHGVFHERRQGKASRLVPAWVDEILDKHPD